MAGADIAAHLLLSTERLVAISEGLPPTRWRKLAPARSWSASEVVEHVVLTNRRIGSLLERGLAPLDGAGPVADDEIPYLFYRGEEPPDVAAPTGTWDEVGPAISALRASVEQLVSWHASHDGDPRAVGARHPAFGMLDAMQWLLFAQAHMERHRAQVIGMS